MNVTVLFIQLEKFYFIHRLKFQNSHWKLWWNGRLPRLVILSVKFLGSGRAHAHVAPTRKLTFCVCHFRRLRRR